MTMIQRGPLQGPKRPNSQNKQSAAQEATMNQGSGDIVGLTAGSESRGFQDSLPDLDLRTTWFRPGDKDSGAPAQQGYALTIRSMRGGLQMQKDFVSRAHLRQAESTLQSQLADQLILQFETEVQATPDYSASVFGRILHTNFNGQLVMVLQGSNVNGQIIFYHETSITDPTITSTTVAGIVGVQINSMTVMDFGPIRRLVLGITYTAGQGGGNPFGYLSFASLNSVPLYAASQYEVPGSSPVFYSPFAVASMVRSPLPSRPLIIKSLESTWLQPVINADLPDWASGGGDGLEPATIMNNAWAGGDTWPIGVQKVGGSQPRIYYLSFDGTWAGLNLVSCDAFGMTNQYHDLSLQRLLGGVGIPARQLLALHSDDSVILWDGREKDTGIFYNEKSPNGYYCIVRSLGQKNGALYAVVNEIPLPNAAGDAAGIPLGYSAGQLGRGSVRTCIRMYDFDLERWFQVSDWTILSEDGFIRKDYGYGPQPVVLAGISAYSFITALGSPDMPISEGTGNIVTPIIASTPLPIPNRISWLTKFEPIKSVNPYSYQGSSKSFAASGRARTPGLLMDGENLYLDKYIDEVYSGADDSGGVGSSWYIAIGEYGHLDDVDSNGDRTCLIATFEKGLVHASRRYPFQTNQSSLMNMQIEFGITRGETANLTPQILPATVYFHVDLPEHVGVGPQSFGRSEA